MTRQRPLPAVVPLAFGDFVLDRARQRLDHRDGRAIELAPRLYSALLLLVERAGDLLDKQTLLLALWPGLVVEDNNLSQLVLALRRALGDDAYGSRYIQTVSRRGFRFIAAVTEAVPASDPASAPARRHNLPPQLAPLHGRQADLAAVVDLMRAHPVLTIVGAGGIGKTRLGLAAAAWMAAHAPPADGVWWIEMAAVQDAAAVAAAIAGALGILLPEGRVPQDTLASALGDERALLVLDNCEQVAEGVGTLIGALRARAPGVSVLITSQQPIGVAAEQLYRLATLDVPDHATLEAAAMSGAVALLVERVAALDPNFKLNAANVQAVVDVCRLLDGIALALEMAAARVPLLGIQGVRDRLDRRFDLLIDRTRGRPARQQTLRAALEWSWSLLSDHEQAVLRRLGVFVGGFTLGLAQSVAADSRLDAWRVLDLLSALVDKSLVVNEGGDEPRYRLRATTRAHALERLALAGEDAWTRKQHALAMLGRLEAAEQARWSERGAAEAAISRELDNARAALDWSLSAGEPALALQLHAASMPLWIAAQRKAEGAQRCEALSAQVDERVPAPLAARFWLTVAMMGLISSRQSCAEAAARAAALFRQQGDARGTFEALIVLTGVSARRAAHDTAAAALAEARQWVDPAWPARRRAAAAFAGWVSALNANRIGDAVDEAWREVALCREAGNALDTAAALGHVGIAEINLPGRQTSGEALLREAVALFDAAGRPDAAAHVLYSLSVVLMHRDAMDESIEQACRSYRLLRRNGEQALMLGLLPLLAVRRGDHDAAGVALGYAAAVYQRSGLKPRGFYTEAQARLHAALPAGDFARLKMEGSLMNEEAVFARVLGARA